MKLRQRVEKFWGVWIFNSRAPNKGMWEPFEEEFSTKWVAREEMRKSVKLYPDEKFALVQTVNVRSRG